jgi:hypothetical protein
MVHHLPAICFLIPQPTPSPQLLWKKTRLGFFLFSASSTFQSTDEIFSAQLKKRKENGKVDQRLMRRVNFFKIQIPNSIYFNT